MIGVRPEACWSLTRASGYIPMEAHIIEPLGAYDIVDLKLGRAVPAGENGERLCCPAGR